MYVYMSFHLAVIRLTLLQDAFGRLFYSRPADSAWFRVFGWGQCPTNGFSSQAAASSSLRAMV